MHHTLDSLTSWGRFEMGTQTSVVQQRHPANLSLHQNHRTRVYVLTIKQPGMRSIALHSATLRPHHKSSFSLSLVAKTGLAPPLRFRISAVSPTTDMSVRRICEDTVGQEKCWGTDKSV
jgi:hypothetical protein